MTVLVSITTSMSTLEIPTDAIVQFHKPCAWLEDHWFTTTNQRERFCKDSHRVMYCQYGLNRPIRQKALSSPR